MQIIKQLTGVVLPALIIGIFLGWLLFSSGAEVESAETAHTETMQEWTCSMHPQIRRHEPGKCPICGMELIPVSSSDASAEMSTAVVLAPAAMDLAGVQTTVVNFSPAVAELQLTGKVQPDERAVYTQAAHIPGRLERLIVDFTGQAVAKGTVLAYVYAPELVTAQQELLEAQKMAATQPQLLQAARQKLLNWKLTDQDIQSILQEGKPRETWPVVADQSGVVTDKLVREGDYVQRGQPIYQLADLSRLWLLLDVHESDLSWLAPGQPVSYTVAALPGKTFQGTVTFVDPVIQPDTRVAKARVVVDNSEGKFKPEMLVNATVTTTYEDAHNQLIVPKGAVLWTGRRSVVYVRQSAGTNAFAMREVTLGAAVKDGYILIDGLKAGEELVTKGTFSIDAAAELAGKPSMMLPHDEQPLTSGVETVPADILTSVYHQYLSLKDALVADQVQDALNVTKGLIQAINQVQMEAFEPKSHQIWMQNLPDLKKETAGLAKARSLNDLRESFLLLSQTMIHLAQQLHPYDQVLYVAHCPMANEYKGADWLSLSKEIENPYFGASMRTCGEVTDTISIDNNK